MEVRPITERFLYIVYFFTHAHLTFYIYLTAQLFIGRHGVKQKKLSILLVSQFTLYGTLSKKNQPDYKLAMKAIPAEILYNKFLSMVRENYCDSGDVEDKIQDGEFGAMMDVELINDGPVTLVIEDEPGNVSTSE